MKILLNKKIEIIKEMRNKFHSSKVIIDANKHNKNMTIKSMREDLEKIYNIVLGFEDR